MSAAWSAMAASARGRPARSLRVLVDTDVVLDQLSSPSRVQPRYRTLTSATQALRAWACRVGRTVCPYRRPALTRPSQGRGNPAIGLRSGGHDTGGCARQPAALSSVIMLGRGKARRWQARQASRPSSRRTLPGAAELSGPGSALSRPHHGLATLKRAKADRFAIASQTVRLGVPRLKARSIMEDAFTREPASSPLVCDQEAAQ
jgi:hypothetical protein